MKNLTAILFAISLTMIFSCRLGDRLYTIEYVIDNQSDFEIKGVSSSEYSPDVESFRISSGGQSVVLSTGGLGNVKKVYKKTTSVHFDQLTIMKTTGEELIKDQWDIDNWTGVLEENIDLATYTLTITDDDF